MPSRRDDEPIATTSPLIADRGDTPGGSNARKKSKQAPVQGTSATMKLLLMLTLLGVIGLAVWITQLQKQLQSANGMLMNYQQHMSALENRLSITDESMLQSDTQFQDKVKFLDTEVRKLWDNVWKKTKEQLAAHQTLITQQQQALSAQQKTIVKLTKTNDALAEKLKTTNIAISALDEQLALALDNSSTIDQLQAQLSGVSKALETLQSRQGNLTTEQAALAKRVKEAEEWVESFNGYRLEVNQKLLALQGQ